MKTITIISIIVLSLMFITILIWLRNEWKEGRKPNSDDTLHRLNMKIENCMMDDHSEIYLIKEIKELRLNPEIDQEKLRILVDKFERRFKILHGEDEFSPESIFGKVK